MGIEDEKLSIEREIERCDWCGEQDRVEKVYSSPGDDIENPRAFHKKCFSALKAFMMLNAMNDSETTESLVKLANKIAGVEIKKKKK